MFKILRRGVDHLIHNAMYLSKTRPVRPLWTTRAETLIRFIRFHCSLRLATNSAGNESRHCVNIRSSSCVCTCDVASTWWPGIRAVSESCLSSPTFTLLKSQLNILHSPICSQRKGVYFMMCETFTVMKDYDTV